MGNPKHEWKALSLQAGIDLGTRYYTVVANTGDKFLAIVDPKGELELYILIGPVRSRAQGLIRLAKQAIAKIKEQA